jgi:hypothetical protein
LGKNNIMLRYFTLFSILLLVFSNKSAGQIVNGGFEEWEEVEGYIKPVGWELEPEAAIEEYQYLVRDTISVEGDYSLKVIATPSFFTCETDFNPIQTIPTYNLDESISIAMSIKSILGDYNTSGETYLRFFGRIYKNDTIVGMFDWLETGIVENFTEIEIPIEVINPDSLELYITGGASPVPIFTDGCSDFTISWVDDIRIVKRKITNLEGVQNYIDSEIICYPNPSTGLVFVKQKSMFYKRVYVYNALGSLVLIQNMESTSTEINISLKGMYFFKFIDDSELSTPALVKVIVE